MVGILAAVVGVKSGDAATRHRREDVTLRSVFRKGDRIYTVLGIADDPTVEIVDVVSGQVEHHVISSLNFSEYEHLRSDRA